MLTMNHGLNVMDAMVHVLLLSLNAIQAMKAMNV